MSSIEYLKKIKESIETFNKQQQLEILQMLIDNNINISENSNGTFINLSDIENSIMFKLQEYIDFVNTQNIKLSSIEIEKQNIEKKFFDKKSRNSTSIGI